jgi:hypothetical protein
MLLEDDADAARRLDAHEMKDFSNAAADFAPDDAARLAFGEAMIGNFDWCLKFSPDDRYRCDARHPLWNLLALDRRNGTALPLMFDFDLSGMVTGRHPWYHRAFTDLYAGPGKRPLTEVVAQLQHARTVFPRAVLDRTRALFAARRGDLYAAVHDAAVDDTGRTFASEYLDAFFHAIGRDEDFYLPVVVDGTTHAWIDPGRHQLACEGDSHVPVGTPVGTIVARDRRYVRAPLLDAQWKWTNTCPAIRQQAVWIEADAISADYPPRQD